MTLRLDGAVLVVLIASALLWIEHGHRVATDAPTAAFGSLSVPKACPDSENVPYGANCIVFMQGDELSPEPRWRAYSVEVTPTAFADASGPACPANNENVPYSSRCIRFMSGWFWRPHP